MWYRYVFVLVSLAPPRSRHFIFDALATALPPFVCTYLSLVQMAVLPHTVTTKPPSLFIARTDPQPGFGASVWVKHTRSSALIFLPLKSGSTLSLEGL